MQSNTFFSQKLGRLRSMFVAVTFYTLDLLENKLSLDDMFRGSQGIGDVMSDMWKQNSNNKSAAISQAGISYNSGQSQFQAKSIKAKDNRWRKKMLPRI